MNCIIRLVYGVLLMKRLFVLMYIIFLSVLQASASDQRNATEGYSDPYGLTLINTSFLANPGDTIDITFLIDTSVSRTDVLNDYQLMAPAFNDTGPIERILPDARRLNHSKWRRLYSSSELNKVCVSVVTPELKSYRNSYELWGVRTDPDSKSEPAFLGYINVIPNLKSFAEFLDTPPLHMTSEQLSDKFRRYVQVQPKAALIYDLHIELTEKIGLQHYKMDSILGEGCDGYVVKALPVDDQSNPVVAIKMWSIRGGCQGVQNLSIQNEILARRFFPPERIARLLSDKEQPISGMRCLVMEFIDGITLTELIKNGKPMSLAAGKQIFDQLFETLESSRINLYDLIGKNIMVTESNELYDLRFIDFAKWEDGFLKSDLRKLRDSIEFYIQSLVPLISSEHPKQITVEFESKLDEFIARLEKRY